MVASGSSCPAFEMMSNEAYKCLHGEIVKGFRVSLTSKFLNEKLFISSCIGPESSREVDFTHPKLAFSGNVTGNVRAARMNLALTEKILVKGQVKPKLSNGLVKVEYNGLSYIAQLQLGSKGLIGATYTQRVTPNLCLGGEIIWGRELQRSDVGCAARYENKKMVASAQLATTGGLLLTYLHKVSEKVSLATDCVANIYSRDVKASVGCDYTSGQSRGQIKIDSNGVASGLLEDSLGSGLKGILCASLDNENDIKFGVVISISS